MKVLGYLKKQPKWNVVIDKDGDLVSGNNYNGKVTQIKVPIFEARLRYKTYYKGRSSVAIEFEAAHTNDQEGLVDELKGINPKGYSATLNEGLEILNLAMHGKCKLHEDGWFTGTFTFAKKGSTLTITPFTGILENEDILSNN